jgi:hypothetical protein
MADGTYRTMPGVKRFTAAISTASAKVLEGGNESAVRD